MRSIRRALDGSVPLIGFSGSPYTLACYMIEGGGSDDYRHIKTMLYSRPDLLHHILDINAQAVTTYLNAQIEAGAQAVMIFDSWGGALSHAAYHEFSLAYMEKIVSGLTREKDGAKIIAEAQSKAAGIGKEATARAEKVAIEMKAAAEGDLAKQREAALAEAQVEREKILGDLRGQVAALSIAAAQKLIGDALDEKRQHSLINEFFSGVKAGKGAIPPPTRCETGSTAVSG